jgi:putative oxidoreductase
MNATNAFLSLVARALLGALFMVAGIRGALAFAGTAAYMGRLGFPLPEVAAVLTIAIEVGGSALLIIGWKTRWAALLLALFAAIAAFAGHRFWQVHASQYTNELHHFLKDLAVAGGMLMIALNGPGRLSVDGR